MTNSRTFFPTLNTSQNINCWIQCWRCASTSEEKSGWVNAYQLTAEGALKSPLLSYEEYSILLVELSSMPTLDPQYSFDEGIVGIVDGALDIGRGVHIESLPCPSLSPPSSQRSSSFASVDSLPPIPVSAPTPCLPSLVPKKRGRKPGSKDREQRVKRGTLANLSHAEKSRRSREKAKQHKLQDQQQQSQQ